MASRKIADRHYAPPGADWVVSADDLVQEVLSVELSKHVPGWPGATDDQLYAVAQRVINALDDTPRAKIDIR